MSALVSHWMPLDWFAQAHPGIDIVGRRIVGPFARFAVRYVPGADGEPEEVEALLPGSRDVTVDDIVTTRVVSYERTSTGEIAWAAAGRDGTLTGAGPSG